MLPLLLQDLSFYDPSLVGEFVFGNVRVKFVAAEDLFLKSFVYNFFYVIGAVSLSYDRIYFAGFII